MKILSYQFKSDNSGWDFPEVKLNNINLIVGDSATGKSIFLNTIFNAGRFVCSGKQGTGHWKINLEHKNVQYYWEVKSQQFQHGIEYEKIAIKDGSQEIVLLERRDKDITWKNEKLPKLSQTQSCINLLQDEDDIRPLFEAFSLIMERRFDGSILEKSKELPAFSETDSGNLENKKTIEKLFKMSLPLSIKLYILKKDFRDLYDKIKMMFIEAFPFVKSFAVKDIKDIKDISPNVHTDFGLVPAIVIYETKDKKQPILHNTFSSGMLKVLLLITDIYTMPENSLLLIDEYENSLGIGPINFLPNILDELSENHQVIMTSHHPYIINRIPVNNWYVFNRIGSNVTIKYGEELERLLGKSKQQAFTKLINQDFYNDPIK